MQYNHKKLSRRRGRIYLGTVVFLYAVVCVPFMIAACNSQTPVKTSASLGAPQYWKVMQNQTTLKNNDIVFAIKDIEISHQEFRFFYALKSSRSISFHAVSTLSQAETISLSTRNQQLGKLGMYMVGVVHVHRIDRMNQVITLQVLVQDHPATWSLAPLQQRLLNRNPNESVSIAVNQNQGIDILWYGPVMPQKVAFFKNTSAQDASSDATHIFLRFDDPVQVIKISRSQYLAIAGQQNYS